MSFLVNLAGADRIHYEFVVPPFLSFCANVCIIILLLPIKCYRISIESAYYKRGDFTVTIKDVARYANVSPSTVSRVIKGNKKISLATIQKVQTAMDELNYFPNQAARTLITKNKYNRSYLQK